jgi:hypothetical protein
VGAVQTWDHTPSPTLNLQYCYAVSAIYGAGPTTEIAHVKATPLNATSTIAWRYNSGSTSVVPPTVAADAIYTVDNAGVVHAMQRGLAGGAWPTGWNPLSLGKPAQSRSPFLNRGLKHPAGANRLVTLIAHGRRAQKAEAVDDSQCGLGGLVSLSPLTSRLQLISDSIWQERHGYALPRLRCTPSPGPGGSQTAAGWTSPGRSLRLTVHAVARPQMQQIISSCGPTHRTPPQLAHLRWIHQSGWGKWEVRWRYKAPSSRLPPSRRPRSDRTARSCPILSATATLVRAKGMPILPSLLFSQLGLFQVGSHQVASGTRTPT